MLLAPDVALHGTLVDIPSGTRGVWATVAAMRTLVDQGKTDPAIIQAAVSTIYLTPPKDAAAECEALFSFVQSSIRYVQDVVGVETLCSPAQTLLRKVGDCDDQSTLLAALFESVGYPTRFVVAGYAMPADFTHVYLQVLVNGLWIDCDPTEDHPFGWAPPDPTKIQFENVSSVGDYLGSAQDFGSGTSVVPGTSVYTGNIPLSTNSVNDNGDITGAAATPGSYVGGAAPSLSLDPWMIASVALIMYLILRDRK